MIAASLLTAALPCARLHPTRRPCCAARAQSGSNDAGSRTATLRQLLARPGILLGPCCHDGISARLIEQAGFGFSFMSGFCTAAARLGAPDTGLISYHEMVDQGRNIHEATRQLPIIGDGDTGYGNAVNVKRTVRGYAAAGFAGVLIEDQQWPKSCGHVRNKRVVGREEAVSRIRAACDARDEGSDILIVARSDARQAASLEEALWRAAAFADAGADVIFIDALETEGEMAALCSIPGSYKMASMLEGGGKTPILSPSQLESLGFDLCAYPLSLLGVSVRAMEVALQGLKQGRVPAAPAMPTFQELQAAVGFPEYYAEEERYAVSLPGATSFTGPAAASARASSSNSSFAAEAAAASAPAAATLAVEPDDVVEPGQKAPSSSSTSSGAGSDNGTIDLAPMAADGRRQQGGAGGQQQYGQRDPADRRARWLRILITDARSGTTKLDTRLPAGFLDGVAAFVPAVAGVDLEGLVRQAAGEDWEPSKPMLDLPSGKDRIQIFLEFS